MAAEHDDQTGVSRRKVLGGAAALLGGAAATQADELRGLLADDRDRDNHNNDTNTTTSTPTTSTTTKEPETGFIDFQPEKGSRDSPIYDMLTKGEISYTVDIDEALERKRDDLEHWANVEEVPELAKVPQKIQNPDWVEQQIHEYNTDEDIPLPPYEGGFSWEQYAADGNFKQRTIESEFINEGEQDGFRYPLLINLIGGVNSTDNERWEALIHELEIEAGNEDTYTVAHQRADGHHGLVTLIENATYDEDKYGQQDTWVIETDSEREHQVMNLAEEGYVNEGKHPAETGGVESMYTKIVGNTDDSIEAESLNVGEEEKKNFAYALNNPEEGSLAEYRDKSALALEVAMDTRFTNKAIWIRPHGIEIAEA